MGFYFLLFGLKIHIHLISKLNMNPLYVYSIYIWRNGNGNRSLVMVGGGGDWEREGRSRGNADLRPAHLTHCPVSQPGARSQIRPRISILGLPQH